MLYTKDCTWLSVYGIIWLSCCSCEELWFLGNYGSEKKWQMFQGRVENKSKDMEMRESKVLQAAGYSWGTQHEEEHGAWRLLLYAVLGKWLYLEAYWELLKSFKHGNDTSNLCFGKWGAK